MKLSNFGMPNRPKISKTLALRIFDQNKGLCYHCGTRLDRMDRSSYHIDHHPVAYRDIEGQCCFGVTDPLAENNLVASCPKCNMSHEHEKVNCFGSTQKFPFKRKWLNVAIWLTLMTVSNTVTFYIAKN